RSGFISPLSHDAQRVTWSQSQPLSLAHRVIAGINCGGVLHQNFTFSLPISLFSFYPPAPGKGSTLRWDGKKFEEIPIAHIKATYNNTHILITSHENVALTLSTCGSEGFKSARKATAIAAQTTGIAVAAKASAKGVSHVRVVVKGLGPGRLAAIKGLTMGGLEVISITDDTPIPHNGCRPRKARRL
uniref:Small ribosomal subunit protein uS11m n=1 Tax=Podarcis muralis TaxID=64176 RepID=A0A670JYN9_PODMU